MEISEIKISELSRITELNKANVSKYFKQKVGSQLTRVNNRIVGISPEAAEEFLRDSGLNYFYRPSIILSANLCGGVGKTTSALNLGACLRRITNRKTAIVFIDGDPQGSFTSSVFGKPADDEEPVLIDVLEGKAKAEDVLTEIKNNIWFVKSNLNQIMLDKVLSKPQEIKKRMLEFYKSVFNILGNDSKIFQDHTPQLSSLFASSICALQQLDSRILKSVVIPMRADNYAIHGANYIIEEINELNDTFSSEGTVDIHCYFSSLDRRISSTSEALKVAKENEQILNHLSPVVVRYCSEVTKGIMHNKNVYKIGKTNKAAHDYQDLLQYIFSYDGEQKI